MTKKIFVSHAKEDTVLAHSLIYDLLIDGIGVDEEQIFCFSKNKSPIPTGTKDFVDWILKEVYDSSAMIMLISKHYLSSQFSMCEMGAAWALNKRMFPIIVPPLDVKDVHGILVATQKLKINDFLKLSEFKDELMTSLGNTLSENTAWTEKLDIFKSKLHNFVASSLRIEPLNIFQDWYDWKEWLDKECSKERIKEEVKVAQVLIHSIQPAYYFKEIDWLIKKTKELGTKRIGSELKLAIDIVLSACQFYEKSSYQTKFLTEHNLSSLIEQLEISADNKYDYFSIWVDVISTDYLGLCFKNQADILQKNEKYVESMKTLKKAATAYKRALKILDGMNEKEVYWYLWKGYLTRNLGLVYNDLGDRKKAFEILDKSLKSRNLVHMRLKYQPLSSIILLHLRWEVLLVRLDMLKHGYRDELNEFYQAVDELKEIIKDKPPIDLIKIAVSEAIIVAELFQDKKVLKDLTRINRSVDVLMSN